MTWSSLEHRCGASLKTGQPIALAEAAMLPHCLVAWCKRLAGRNVVWFCDNTSAMHSFVKGASKNAILERIVNLTWLLSYPCQTHIWIEWIDSDSNWADGISREYGKDEWLLRHHFVASERKLDAAWWFSDLPELMKRAAHECA